LILELIEMDASAQRLSLGVISDSALHRRHMLEVANRLRLDLSVNCDASNWLEKYREHAVDCWLVETEDDSVLDLIGEHETALVIGELSFFDDVSDGVDRANAEKRLLAIISQAIAETGKARGADLGNEPEEIWVLAASLGGPEAVKLFLDNLEPDLPCTFLYAQHLDQAGLDALMKVITRNAPLPVADIEGLTELTSGTVQAISTSYAVDFCGLGAYPSVLPWRGDYQPSIAHLLDLASRQYGQRVNVIFFSGMGDDGGDMAVRLANNGSQVWAQTPESCVSAAMPESVIQKNICQQVDEPAALAKALVARYKRDEKVRNIGIT
jgi:chemosensory pili system protein ChpB (putative protein-glutamate methylesterase)